GDARKRTRTPAAGSSSKTSFTSTGLINVRTSDLACFPSAATSNANRPGGPLAGVVHVASTLLSPHDALTVAMLTLSSSASRIVNGADLPLMSVQSAVSFTLVDTGARGCDHSADTRTGCGSSGGKAFSPLPPSLVLPLVLAELPLPDECEVVAVAWFRATA